jgi:acyl phosphate:glycerol-3-phosphate acyltransferase
MMLVIAMGLSYLLGSLSGSLLLGRLRGVDIRQSGSGNAGATNALRTQGKLFATTTALIDVLKGFVAAALLSRIAVAPEAPYACSLAAVLGHCFPVFFGFKGGKGAGTALGAYLWLAPSSAGLAFVAWLLCLTIGGYVGPSTALAAVVAMVGVLWLDDAPMPALLYALSCMGLVVVMHRGNLQRWLAGTEYRFERVRVWARWLK